MLILLFFISSLGNAKHWPPNIEIEVHEELDALEGPEEEVSSIQEFEGVHVFGKQFSIWVIDFWNNMLGKHGIKEDEGPSALGHTQCGETLTAAHGEITPEGYPESYENWVDCIWNIQPTSAVAGQVIQFTVIDFDVEWSGNCVYDYVQFLNKDGSKISLGTGKAANDGKLCGKIIPNPFFSIRHEATIKFHSDGSIAGKGFKIKYDVISQLSSQESCLNQQLTTSTGIAPVEFTSCHYPSRYDNNDDCAWTISVPKGEAISLEFTKFNTESRYDYVKVYDGDSNKEIVLGRFSGSRKPPLVSSTGNKMLVIFRSDESITYPGFAAVATAFVFTGEKATTTTEPAP
jgi:hypothetical protein